MSRIGIDARLFGPRVGGGGLGRYVEQLVLHLEQLDHENEYVIFLGKENWDEYQPKSSNFKKILAPWRWYTLTEQLQMPRLIDSTKLSFVHYPHFNVPIFAKTPFIVTVHDLNLLEYPKIEITTLDPIRFWSKYLGFRAVLRHALTKSQKIIAVSETTKQSVLKNFQLPEDKIVTIAPGYTVPPILPITNYQLPITSYILAVGNAYPHKNLSGLLRAFKIIHETHPELKLVLVGPEDRFRARIKKETLNLGLQSHVIFPGFVSDEELDTLYRNAVALIFPSFLEGFGFPGLEAQAQGMPVLASDIPALRETYTNAAAYFNPHDPKNITQAITMLLSDDQLRSQLIQNGYENIKRFSWREAATRTLAVYRELQKNA